MDSNSLPMALDLDVFPRLLRLLFVGVVVLFVALVVLSLIIGLLSV
ncbi:hypothetical protein [Haloarchaeobius amylolyticus]|nr:hypothetical protein [Haloarchaeobius amylolyticus]